MVRQSSTANPSQLTVALVVVVVVMVAGDDNHDEEHNERFAYLQIRYKKAARVCVCVSACAVRMLYVCALNVILPQYECYAYKMDFCST